MMSLSAKIVPLILLASLSVINCDTRVTSNFCEGCRKAVSLVARLNSTENHAPFSRIMKDMCKELYPPSTDYRHGPCDYYEAKIFQLMKMIDPATHCDEIGACDSQVDQDITLSLDGPKKAIQSVNENVVCNICVDTLNQFKESLTDPKNIEQIRDGFRQLCNHLKRIHEEKLCLDLFDNYFNQLLDYVQKINSKAYCAALSLCDKPVQQTSVLERIMLPTLGDLLLLGPQTSVRLTKETDLMPAPSETNSRNGGDKKLNDSVCFVCKTIIRKIDSMINPNSTEAAIGQALDEVCNLIYKPSTDGRKQCEFIVAEYSKDIVKIVQGETGPELVCMLLDLCYYEIHPKLSPARALDGSSHFNKVALPTVMAGGNPKKFQDLFTLLDNTLNMTSEVCIECKLFVHFIKNKMSDVKSLEEFKNLLDTKICARISDKAISDACKNFVNEYSPAFFQAIVENLNTEEVCEELQACKPKEELLATEFDFKEINPIHRENYCDTCTSTVSYIDKLLATQSVDRDISHLIEIVCNNFPESGRNECRLIIDTFGPEILRAVATMNNPRQLCTDIGLCHKDPKQKHLLGEAKCSIGPGYWCLSKEHAAACRAHEYCLRKVWKAIPN